MAEIEINGLAELETAISIKEMNADSNKPARQKSNRKAAAEAVKRDGRTTRAKVDKLEKEAAAKPIVDMVPVVDKNIESKRLHRYGKYPAARVGDSTPNQLMTTMATQLPKAYQQPLYYQAGDSVDFTELEGFVGTFVDFDGRTIAVDTPTPRYELVQHYEAFAPYVEALAQHHGSDHLRAAMTYNAREAFVYVSLPDQLTFTPSDGKPIEMGFIMHNSYDRSSTIDFTGYGLRVACMNMLGFQEILGKTSIRHTDSAPDKLKSMLKGFESQIEVLGDQIDFARSIGVKDAEAKEWFRAVFGDKLQMVFLAQFRQEEQTSWGLYQAVTNVVSHHPSFTGDKQFDELMAAEPILWTPEDSYTDPETGITVQGIREIFENTKKENEQKDTRKLLMVEARAARKAALKAVA